MENCVRMGEKLQYMKDQVSLDRSIIEKEKETILNLIDTAKSAVCTFASYDFELIRNRKQAIELLLLCFPNDCEKTLDEVVLSSDPVAQATCCDAYLQLIHQKVIEKLHKTSLARIQTLFAHGRSSNVRIAAAKVLQALSTDDQMIYLLCENAADIDPQIRREMTMLLGKCERISRKCLLHISAKSHLDAEVKTYSQIASNGVLLNLLEDHDIPTQRQALQTVVALCRRCQDSALLRHIVAFLLDLRYPESNEPDLYEALIVLIQCIKEKDSKPFQLSSEQVLYLSASSDFICRKLIAQTTYEDSTARGYALDFITSIPNNQDLDLYKEYAAMFTATNINDLDVVSCCRRAEDPTKNLVLELAILSKFLHLRPKSRVYVSDYLLNLLAKSERKDSGMKCDKKKEISATIVKPEPNPHTPLSVTANWPFNINVELILSGTINIDTLVLQVQFGPSESQEYQMRSEYANRLSDNTCRYESVISMTLPASSTAFVTSLCVCARESPEEPQKLTPISKRQELYLHPTMPRKSKSAKTTPSNTR